MRPRDGYIRGLHSQHSRRREQFPHTRTLLFTCPSHLLRITSGYSLSATESSFIDTVAIIMKLSWTIFFGLAPAALALAPVVLPVLQSQVFDCPDSLPNVCTFNCTILKPYPAPPKYSYTTQCISSCVNLQNDPKNCGSCGTVVSSNLVFLQF